MSTNNKVGWKAHMRQAVRKAGILPKDRQWLKYHKLYKRFESYTMNPERYYINNLMLAERFKHLPGDVVECGVWRGGMIAGMSTLLGKNRHYYLYDSFEGLPPATEKDGYTAIAWQSDKNSDSYFNNCAAEMHFAEEAMKQTGVQFTLVKGWFNDTIPLANHQSIGILRLDGDWYDSTMVCLKHLFPKVVPGGLIILDDYHFWDGCSKATHDYLSEIQSTSRIFSGHANLAYIIKKES